MPDDGSPHPALARPGRRTQAQGTVASRQSCANAGACPRSPRKAAAGQGNEPSQPFRMSRAPGGIRVSSPSHADLPCLREEAAPRSFRLIKPACPDSMPCGNAPESPDASAISDRSRPDKAAGTTCRLPAFSHHECDFTMLSIGLLTMRGGLDDPAGFAKWRNRVFLRHRERRGLTAAAQRRRRKVPAEAARREEATLGGASAGFYPKSAQEMRRTWGLFGWKPAPCGGSLPWTGR
jgi:hypothetical protein